MRRYMVALSLSALGVAGLAAAAPQAPDPQTGMEHGRPAQPASSAQAGRSAAKDAAFIKEAAADGLAEVELGQLAATKASRPEVKQFAQMMVDDHGKANDELKQLASRKSVTIPTEPTAAQKAEKARLEKLSGAAFDDAYAQAMEKDHRKAVNLFSKQASSGADPEVKQWAEQKLPTLKEHLAKAGELAGAKHGTGAPKP